MQDSLTQANDNFERYNIDFAESVDKYQGRIESRRCWVSYDALPHIDGLENWDGLQTIVRVEAERTVKYETPFEHRYYISSTSKSAVYLLGLKRQHWGIETSLHWCLDIAFREDESTIRKGNGAENFAILRHIALNLLKKEDTTKIGIKNKRLKARWDEDYIQKGRCCIKKERSKKMAKRITNWVLLNLRTRIWHTKRSHTIENNTTNKSFHSLRFKNASFKFVSK